MSTLWSRVYSHGLIKWSTIIIATGISVGIISAVFLFALNYVSNLREQNNWIVLFLPLAGLLIVYLYKNYGDRASKGNNLILEEYYHPSTPIPWIMAPLVILTTLLTHLFGGSAGREGTAVQYGATVGEQLSMRLQLSKKERRIVLCCGVAAGFASLFGTPLAATIFAVEVFRVGRKRYKTLLPVVITAYLAHGICLILKAPHSHYPQVIITDFISFDVLWIVGLGLLCGIISRLFIYSGDLFSQLFKRLPNAYLRIAIGSMVIIIFTICLGTTKYTGLGLPTIAAAFQQPQALYDFFLKILLTTLTLSIGFKGGEVTPLFFIGATFASALSLYIPVDIMLLTAVGFVSVFAGSTKTPLACAIMAMELFGIPVGIYAVIGCFSAVMVSGRKGIYSSQRNIKF
ncbi:chloride channel protein [Sphingobacterium alkalisoli]|uniref:Chloride channel protein n=1 Tax=Sphingobacterium alkalisoli TaxID=1874115 RepID=A0A4U0GWP9_9SPHI|nr:chloride channel protein [Sphingobacterium alkalisoli]TJY63570.1 chloride channel protein [Sphingobacterium alkalisoli]GGH26896.1 voltage-gated chloride channel protein [Sphingobacterium alkalisoli]